MAHDMGMGNCMIPDANGVYCGRQIGEGEAIGTIVLGGPKIGHKRCADAYHARIQQAEREKRDAMVKRIDQSGPGGPVDHTTEREGIQGSIPLEHRPGDPLREQGSQPDVSGQPPDLAGLAASAGVHSIADVPMEATPDEAVALAQKQGIGAIVSAISGAEDNGADALSPDVRERLAVEFGTGNGGTYTESPPPLLFASMPPDVRAENGMVTLRNIAVDDEGILWLDPDDASALADIIKIQMQRAWRQRQ
jgi:hypothetical protein